MAPRARIAPLCTLASPACMAAQSHFAYRPGPLGTARAYLDRVATQWDDMLGRIKAAVEES